MSLVGFRRAYENPVLRVHFKGDAGGLRRRGGAGAVDRLPVAHRAGRAAVFPGSRLFFRPRRSELAEIVRSVAT